LIHELGHALGLLHEHQRPDRGSFVSIGPQRDDEYDRNYKPDDDGSKLGPYDVTSIMHNPSIAPSDILSAGDLSALRYMYPIHHVVELAESTDAAPALSFDSGSVHLAWRGSGNEHLNSAVVTFDNERFPTMTIVNTRLPTIARTVVAGITAKVTHSDTSDISPALGGAFLVWKGSGNEDLNMALALPGSPLMGKVTLREQTDRAPAVVMRV
jgi:hypothetical protein